MTEVFTKEITILDQINVEEINTHDVQKENFSEYNEEVYIFKDYKFNKASEKEILTSEHIYCKNKKLNNNKAEALITATARDTQNNKKSKNKIIEQRKVWKKAVKQIKIITKKHLQCCLKITETEVINRAVQFKMNIS